MLSPMWTTWFLVLGGLILVVASALESFWEFGRQARADLRPRVFDTPWRSLILGGWIVLLMVSGVMLLLAWPLAAVIAIAFFWLLLPISVGSRIRKRALPPWEDLRKELEPQGYSERNYWRRGDWWKESARMRKPKSEARARDSVRMLEGGKDYHRVLGVSRNASEEQVAEAYRRMAKRYHPDANPGNEDWANERMREINEAYEALHSESRQQSD